MSFQGLLDDELAEVKKKILLNEEEIEEVKARVKELERKKDRSEDEKDELKQKRADLTELRKEMTELRKKENLLLEKEARLQVGHQQSREAAGSDFFSVIFPS